MKEFIFQTCLFRLRKRKIKKSAAGKDDCLLIVYYICKNNRLLYLIVNIILMEGVILISHKISLTIPTRILIYKEYRCIWLFVFHLECIPRNQLEMQCTANDEFLHNDNNTVNGNKMVAASFDTSPREKRLSDAEDGAYNTLNLRVFDYEVPIKHKERKKSYSETSSLYIKCPNGKLSPSSDDENNALVPFIRFTRNTDESMQREIEMHPTMQQIDVKNELCEGNPECSSKAFDDVYDKATFEDTKKEPPRQIFLKELSSRLINNDHMT